jgi:2-iminoacetate synthase ThiH
MDSKNKTHTADNRLHIGQDYIARRVETAHFTPSCRMEVPPFPRNMQLELTNICNYRCSFCASSKIKKSNYATMKPKLFERLAREAFSLGTREVGLYSRGEPFLCPELEDCVALCSTLNFRNGLRDFWQTELVLEQRERVTAMLPRKWRNFFAWT